ncbi:MAG: alpha/beta hydrolase [Bacteroidota bacterium]
MKKLFAQFVPLIYGQYFNFLALLSQKAAATNAFNVFCVVRKGRIQPQQEGYLNQAKYTAETISDHKIQLYRWKGTGSKVLLLHGWESNTFRWRNLVRKLQAANFDIFAFDGPGHGYSSGNKMHVPLYAACEQHIITKYNPRFVIGHSVGGMTALYNEYKNPNSSVERIVTIGSPSEFSDIMNHFQRLLNFNNRVMAALDGFVQDHFGFTIQEFSTSKFVKTNAKKGLLIHDELDAVAPVAASEQVHANWSGSRLLKTSGLGHSMHQEEVNESIISFLQG